MFDPEVQFEGIPMITFDSEVSKITLDELIEALNKFCIPVLNSKEILIQGQKTNVLDLVTDLFIIGKSE